MTKTQTTLLIIAMIVLFLAGAAGGFVVRTVTYSIDVNNINQYCYQSGHQETSNYSTGSNGNYGMDFKGPLHLTCSGTPFPGSN